MALDNVTIAKIGYGQVEPNQLSAQKTGQIYASLPLDKTVTVLQNGEFMFYDYVDNMVTADPVKIDADKMEPMLVFNEIKIYEDWLALKDFAMIRVGDNYVTNAPAIGRVTSANVDGVRYKDGSLTEGATIEVRDEDDELVLEGHTEYGYRMDGIAPRLFKTNIGDIYTTNMVADGEYSIGDILSPSAVTATYKNERTGEDVEQTTLVLTKDGTYDKVQFAVVKCYEMPDGQPAVKIQRIA